MDPSAGGYLAVKAASGTAVASRNGSKTKSKSRSSTIIGDALPNIPWEERPSNDQNAIWRYSGNPVIERSPSGSTPRTV